MDEFKARQKATWEAGDYALLSKRIERMGEHVVARAGIKEGMKVLDVASGTGNAAQPAARAGADVTALDLAAKLLREGEEQARAQGLEITWVEGDAEDLPFEDDSFDAVLSTVGHMFAPRHRRTADEMARVCRPGGTIAIACWTPEGNVGGIFAAGARFAPPPPDYASPPGLWGTEEHVREMFPDATGFEFERDATRATIEAESLEAFSEVFMNNFPPMVVAQQGLGERFGEMRAAIEDVWRRGNVAENGSFVLPQEYLLAVVRL